MRDTFFSAKYPPLFPVRFEYISCEDYKPYAILADIGLPGMSGIDAVRKIRGADIPCEVVFITSSPEYALDAWRVSARQYFVKPPNEEEFFATMRSIIP